MGIDRRANMYSVIYIFPPSKILSSIYSLPCPQLFPIDSCASCHLYHTLPPLLFHHRELKHILSSIFSFSYGFSVLFLLVHIVLASISFHCFIYTPCASSHVFCHLYFVSSILNLSLQALIFSCHLYFLHYVIYTPICSHI